MIYSRRKQMSEETKSGGSELEPGFGAGHELGQLLVDVLGALPGTAITVFDRRMRVLLLSGGAPATLGIDPSLVTGRALSEILPDQDFLRLEPLYRATLAGESRIEEHSLLGAEGVWWMRTAPLTTKSGKVYAGLAIATDVTDRRVAELRRLRLDAQLERARRLEAVGKMAGGVAHDFNNLLAVVMNYADFVAEALPGDSPHHEDLSEIRKAAERGASLTRQLLIFSRREVAMPGMVDLNQVLVDLDKLLRRTLGEDVALDVSLADDLHRIKADAGQIEQAIVGMALNAREAMPDGGSLSIATENCHFDADYAESSPQAREGHFVRVRLADTGVGISPEHVERIFEPFFTTKSRGAGTGLGLAAVHGVVAAAGGHINVYTEPGLGTVFQLHFPAIAEKGGRLPEPEDAPEVSVSEGARILVAEDDDAVRRVGVRVLERAGFEVVACEDGQGAIEQLEAGERFALLLTDVIMPRVSGRELADKAAGLDPSMPVLFMSGYTEEIISSQDVLEGDVTLIRKPFAGRELLAQVNRALGEQEAGA